MEFVNISKIHPSWDAFFTEEIMGYLKQIESSISGPVNPLPENVLRFAQQPLSEVKVIILGQDTYPAAGVATGRAFEVGGLESWETPFRQTSLRHILQSIYSAYTGESAYTKFSDIKPKLSSDFKILPPNKLFVSWSEQGVLLLNAALTCEIGKPGSHSELWFPFITKLLRFISLNCPNAYVFLWGTHAKQFRSVFTTQNVYESRHPMMCSAKYSDDFLKFEGFKDTMHIIDWRGLTSDTQF